MFNNLPVGRKKVMQSFFKRNLKRTLLALLGVTLVVGSLSACGHREERWGANLTAEQYAQKRDKMVDRVAGKLNLTDDQKIRLSLLGDKLYEQRRALVGQNTDPKAEVKALIAGEKFDLNRAQALINGKTSVLQNGSPEVLTALASFYDSLNPTQQQKVRDFMDGKGRWFHRS